MGVFNEEGPGMGMVASKLAEKRCRPDFEGMIQRLRDQKEASDRLFQAAEHYAAVHGQGHQSFTLTELLGHLYLEIKGCQTQIAELIKAQEAEAERPAPAGERFPWGVWLQ